MNKIKYIILAFVFSFALVSCTKPHTHVYINGVCSCGENEPHTHKYENGVCSCGDKDPNYKPLVDIWSWYIDDVKVQELEVARGETPEYPAVPENADDDYRWMKMDSIIDGVVHYDLYLLYKVKICNIQFVNQHGEILKEEKLEWGASATAPYYPENYSVEWDQDFSKVTDDMVIKGNINKIYSTVEFYDGDEKLDLGINRYNVGESLELPEITKEGHQFVGWYLSDISLYAYDEILSDDDSDFVFYARFIKNDFSNITLPNAYGRITEIRANGNYFTPVVNGSTLSYSWVVGDNSIIGVSDYGSISVRSCGVTVLTAVFKENTSLTYNCLVEATSNGVRVVTEEELKEKEVHVVTFEGLNGDVIDQQIIPHGYTAVYPKPNTYDGYAFDGWNKSACNIIEDTTIKAVYIEGSNRFEGKSLAILGDSISTYLNHMPSGYAHFYPYPAGDIRDVNHIWWKIVSNAIGTSVFVDNAWGGTTVVGGSSATESLVRLETLLLGEEAPDIVLIFMGTNDARAKYTNNTFETSYRKMIANIKSIAPNTEIILCNLFDTKATGFFEDSVRIGYNDVIKKIAKDNGLTLIDLSNVNLVKSDFIDSIHPNASGHKKMADEVIRQLKLIK